MEKSRLFVDENALKRQKNRVNALLNAFSIKYNSDLVNMNANNPKSLFRIINRLLHRKEETPMPPHTSESDLANEFSTFFTQKIRTIRDFLDNPQGDGSPKIVWQDEPKFNTQLSEFKLLTEDEVKKVILKSSNKYCELDHIPTNLLRECIDEILPLLTQIINLSPSIR